MKDAEMNADVKAETRSDGHAASDVPELLNEFVNVCNRALVENEDRVWFRQAKRLNRVLWGETDFCAAVYDDHPDHVIHESLTHFDADEQRLSLEDMPDDEVSFRWKVPLDYLEDVAHRPDWYVEHPAMLDVNWASHRIRDEAVEIADRPMWKAAAGLTISAAIGIGIYASLRGKRGSA